MTGRGRFHAPTLVAAFAVLTLVVSVVVGYIWMVVNFL